MGRARSPAAGSSSPATATVTDPPGYPAVALQLFVMDDRDTSISDDETPTNLEKIGHLNIPAPCTRSC